MADLGKRYSRNLTGINAMGAVSVNHAAVKPIVEGHTSFEQTTPAGVVSYVTGTALAAANSYRLVQLQDGDIRGSVSFLGSDVVSITNQDYVAPVVQVDKAIIPDSDLATLLGIAGLKEFVLASRDTTPSNQPFPVIEGRSVVRNVTTTTYDMLTDLIKQMNGDYDYERNSDDLFAVAALESTVPAGAVTVATGAVLSQGSNVAVFNAAPTGPAVGEFISFVVAPTSVADLYKITAIDGANVSLDRVWHHADQTVLIADMLVGAVASGGTWNISMVGTTDDTHFSTIASEDLGDFAVSTTSPWKQGSGDPASVAAMEEEFYVFAGATTINAQWEEDYGKPTRFTQAGETYGLSFIKYKKNTASMAFANEMAHHVGYIILANDGGTAIVVAVA